MKNVFPKVLYFITDFLPDDEQTAEAATMGPNVMFRNASFIPENPSPGSLESCDFVAGEVPEAYKDYPRFSNDAAGKFVSERVGKSGKKPSNSKPAKSNDAGKGGEEAGGAAGAASTASKPASDDASKSNGPNPNPGAGAAWAGNKS